VRDATGNIDRVLVLGGDSDIGAAIADALVRERGAGHVVLAARNPDALDRRVAALEAAGAQSTGVRFDATDFDSHDRFVADVFDAHGDVDVVVLAFGRLGDQARAEADASHARDLVEANFTGAVSVLVPLAERLTAQGHGTIVVLSTVAAVQPRRANYTYGAAKAGLDAFARGLSDALAPHGVRVLVVRPGFVTSKMTAHLDPAPFATDPGEVARRVLDGLDRPGAGVVWAPRAVGAVGHLLSALPRPVLRRLPR
jgi:decaprenylphospho-beta-D-erythro-pentofuranosid-2-ulose 2-reductase